MASSIRLVVGLGNPGAEYADTRHNAGFWLVNALADALGGKWLHTARFSGLVCRVSQGPDELYLLLPQTYMNRSGISVGALARFYKIAPHEILVAHDELDFQPGDIRLKLGGGAGGHNGLKDIDAALGVRDYWRLRLGIGHPGDRSLVTNWVLHRPSLADRQLIDDAIARVVCERTILLNGDMVQAMQCLHSRK